MKPGMASSALGKLKDKLGEVLGLLESQTSSVKPVNIYVGGGVDGAAASIMVARLLLKLGCPFRLRWFKQSGDMLQQLRSEGLSILVDVGGAEALIRKLGGGGRWIVFSHHLPVVEESGVLTVNPELYGFDGSTEACCSSTCYLLLCEAKAEDEVSKLLLCLGVMGEEQVLEPDGDVKGIDGACISPLLKEGRVKVAKKLKVFAASKLPLFKSLAYTLNPPIMSLMGSEEAALRFLKSLELGEEASSIVLPSLGSEGKGRLVQALVKEAIVSGVDAYEAGRFLGPVLEANFDFFSNDLYEEACIMDACVKAGRLGLAVSGFMKRFVEFPLKEALEEAVSYVKSLTLELSRLSPIIKGSAEKLKVYELQPLAQYSLIELAKALRCFNPEGVTVTLTKLDDFAKVAVVAGRKLVWDKEVSAKLVGKVLDMEGMGWGSVGEVEALLPSSKLPELLSFVGEVSEG